MGAVCALLAGVHSSVSSAEAPESWSTLIDLSVNHSIHVFCIELDGGDGDARQMVGGELLRRPFVLRVPRPIAAFRLRQVLSSVDVGHELWAASSVDLDDGE